MEIDPEENNITRQLKLLFVLGENNENRKDSLKFLSEFYAFYDEYSDRHIPPDLRELVRSNEKIMGIKITTFTEQCDDHWVGCQKGPIQYRDNDRRQMREFFDDNYKIWLPLCDYEIRDYWAQNYCGCASCMWKSTLRDNKKNGCSNDEMGPCPEPDKTCTKIKFYLPYGERDDDCGTMDYEG